MQHLMIHCKYLRSDKHFTLINYFGHREPLRVQSYRIYFVKQGQLYEFLSPYHVRNKLSVTILLLTQLIYQYK